MSDGFMMVGSGRLYGIVPVAVARWMPKEFNPDSSTWRPVFRRFGLTRAQAERRARRAADMEWSRNL